MVPNFTADGLLPPGDITLTFAELRDSVLVNGPGPSCPNWDAKWRHRLVDNLEIMVRQLWQVGITDVYADGHSSRTRTTRTMSTAISSVTCVSSRPGGCSASSTCSIRTRFGLGILQAVGPFADTPRSSCRCGTCIAWSFTRTLDSSAGSSIGMATSSSSRLRSGCPVVTASHAESSS